MNLEFNTNNLAQWKNVVAQLFPDGFPKIAQWAVPTEIAEVLSQIGQPNLVHLFYPDNGGNDLTGAMWAGTSQALWIMDGTHQYVEVSPIRLTFRSFGVDHLDWAYFHLETGRFESTGVNENVGRDDLGRNHEVFFRLPDGSSISRHEWAALPPERDDDRNEATMVRRFGSGCLVFWPKGSPYNVDDPLNAYNAPHATFTEEEYFQVILKLRESLFRGPSNTPA